VSEIEQWFYGKRPGELLTQVSKPEFHELMQEILTAGKLDLEAHFQAENKRARVRARKLMCVSNLCQSPPRVAELLQTSWRTLYFRKREGGFVDVELKR
jgi:hypothetical protein